MKIIREPKKNIALLWGQPKPSQSVYRPMKYLLKTEVEDGILLYNIVTSEMILLEDDERRAFDTLPTAYCSEMDGLIAHHFVVKEDFCESKSVLQLRALLKKIEPSKRVTGYTILPTTDCNARCYYCFESDHKRCTMTEKIAADVVEYIAAKGKGEPVQISWFGGEPLVAKKRISQICNGLKNKGIEFKSSMVSNAYLFDEETVLLAFNEWNLRGIQITLDGTEEIYNATKAYINSKDNPYYRVLKNIELLLAQKIAVNVRLNVTDKNISDLSSLIDELKDRFGNQKGFTCYSHAVYEGVGFEPLNYDEEIVAWIDSQTSALDAKLREKELLGSLARLPSLRVIHCMSDNDSCRLIYPDGTIGRCENKSSADSIGDIYQDITNKELNEYYKKVQDIPDCDKCFLFPDCINLVVCPETERCSKTKLDWRKNRYTQLMQLQYDKLKKGELEKINVEDNTECDV